MMKPLLDHLLRLWAAFGLFITLLAFTEGAGFAGEALVWGVLLPGSLWLLLHPFYLLVVVFGIGSSCGDEGKI